MKSLQKKYLEACERLNATTVETERMKIRAEQTSNRCDELEKEKVCQVRSICFSSMLIVP